MKNLFSEEHPGKYELQIKSAILLVAVLLFFFSYRTQTPVSEKAHSTYELRNTK